MGKILILILISLLYGQTYSQNIGIKSPMALKDAIEMALKNNPQIKASSEKINAAKGKFWSGISLPPPTVSLSYEYTPLGKNLKNFGEKTFEINQSFNFPTYYFLRGSEHSIEKEISENENNQVIFKTINQVKTAYFNALAKLELQKIAEENLSILQDFSRKTEIKYNAGECTNVERLTAKVQVSEAINTLESARHQLKNAYSELNFSIGLNKENYLETIILADSLYFHEIPITLEEASELAIKNNPEIQIDRLTVEKSSIEKTEAWLNILPGFNVSYYRQTQDGNSDYYGALFGISVPLWFFMDNRGQIQEAIANHHAAESELQFNMNSVDLKVRTSFLEYKDAEREVLLYRNDILPQSIEVFRTAEKSYDAGEISYLEYLQVKQTLISTRSNYINALLNYNIDLFKLEESIGMNLTNY
jgi:outer membrane protein TolC